MRRRPVRLKAINKCQVAAVLNKHTLALQCSDVLGEEKGRICKDAERMRTVKTRHEHTVV